MQIQIVRTVKWHSYHNTLLCYGLLGSKEGKRAKSKVSEMRTCRLEGSCYPVVGPSALARVSM